MTFLPRALPFSFLLSAALIGGTDASARAESPGYEMEVGIFGGAHLFSDRLELGAIDHPGHTPSPRSAAAIGARVGLAPRPWLVLEVEAVAIPTADRVSKLSALVAGYRGHALVHLLKGKFRPFVLGGAGLMQVASTNARNDRGLERDTDPSLHVGAGLKYFMWDGVVMRAEARAVTLPSYEEFSYTANWELLLGATYRFDFQRTPPPAKRAAAVSEAPKSTAPDRDRDGIDDERDECPRRAEDKDGFEDGDGCPEKDNDTDGVLDAADKCPLEGEDRDYFEDEDGCPDRDNDGDGVLDAADKCPLEPETKNGVADEDGCPEAAALLAPAASAGPGPVVAKGITFRSGSAAIDRGSRPELDAAVKLLKERAEARIEVAGHTSNDGTRGANLTLSKKRADAVKDYLVKAGIDAGRIETVGHGPDKPIAPNATRPGREQNRRIELRLLTK